MSKISINQQIEEVERELAMRAKVYPNMVSRRKLRQSEADFYIQRLQAAKASLEWLRDNREDCVAFITAKREDLSQ